MKKMNTLLLLTAVTAGAYTLYRQYQTQNADTIIDENPEVSNTDCAKDYDKPFDTPAKRGYIHIPLHRQG